MKALFLADAHLRFVQDDNYRALLDLLKQQQDLDALFLMGDIFEFWLGYRNLVFSAYVPLLEQLRTMSISGTKLFFVEGNHDFNLGPYFTEALKCTVIPREKILQWDNRRILLCHGDLIHATTGYRLLRALWRCLPLKWLARVLHPDPIWDFGIRLSDISKNKKDPRNQQDPTPHLLAFAADQKKDQCDLIICGHFHCPVHTIDRNMEIVALGDWQTRYAYAVMDDGRISLRTFSG